MKRLLVVGMIVVMTANVSLNIFYSINFHGIIQYKWLNVRTKKRIRTEAGLIEFLSLNVDVEDGLTNGATGVMKHTDYRMEVKDRPSIILVLFDEPRIGRSAREKYRALDNSGIQREWTPVFDVQRIFILNTRHISESNFFETSFR